MEEAPKESLVTRRCGRYHPRDAARRPLSPVRKAAAAGLRLSAAAAGPGRSDPGDDGGDFFA
jgi:hypothetical protein